MPRYSLKNAFEFEFNTNSKKAQVEEDIIFKFKNFYWRDTWEKGEDSESIHDNWFAGQQCGSKWYEIKVSQPRGDINVFIRIEVSPK